MRGLFAAAGLVLVAACGYPPPPATDRGPVASETVLPSARPAPSGEPAGPDNFNDGAGQTPVTLPDGLKFIDLKVGTGDVAQKDRQLTVQYTGWTSDGKKFDSSRDRGQPFQFVLGQKQVIPGWDEGVAGMKPGGKRKLTVPPALGYGAQGQPPTIPPNATLVFDIELVGVGPVQTPTPTPSPSPS